MECEGDGILCRTVCPIGKLVGVEGGTETVSDVLSDRSVIIQAVYGRFFGDGDDDRGLQTCGDGGMCQREVEDFGADPCQLVCKCFNQIKSESNLQTNSNNVLISSTYRVILKLNSHQNATSANVPESNVNLKA